MKYLSSPIKSNTNIPIFSPPISKTNDINKNNNLIVYIDPPYMNTQQYGFSFNIYELESQIWNNAPIGRLIP